MEFRAFGGILILIYKGEIKGRSCDGMLYAYSGYRMKQNVKWKNHGYEVSLNLSPDTFFKLS